MTISHYLLYQNTILSYTEIFFYTHLFKVSKYPLMVWSPGLVIIFGLNRRLLVISQ